MKKEIPVLMYHKFLKNNKCDDIFKNYVTEKQFELQLKVLKFLKYTTITFEELKNISLENRLDKKYIILTVDDGYKNNYEIMFPLLKKYNMKAVVFLVTDESFNRWDVEEYGENKLELLNKDEIKEMIDSKLVEFGGHTSHHINFYNVSEEIAEKEIFENKEYLEKNYGIKPTAFAYPYGNITDEAKRIVEKAGYDFAVSTYKGTGYIPDDLFFIRRSNIDRVGIFDFLRKISRYYSVYKGEKWKRKK